MKLYVHEYGFCPRVYFLSTLTSEGQDWERDTLIVDRAIDNSHIICLREKNKNCKIKKTIQNSIYLCFVLVGEFVTLDAFYTQMYI